jgi:predicted NBD/HSP70 family sugar kinase
MGRLNKRALLARLQRMGLASRADLAKSLGMSQPTAGKIVDGLLELGVLEEVGELAAETGAALDPGPMVRSRLGRPGRMLRLDRSTSRFVAIQLGVNQTKLAAAPVGVEPDDRWAVEIETAASAGSWVRDLRRAARQFAREGLWGILVSVPGIVDEQAGRVLFSPNLHWTENVNLAALLQRIWSLPVVLVQEERALALGYRYVEPETEDFLLADFGEGVGGAAVVAGRLYANPLPISGEFGHTPVSGNSRKCGCGATGCVETLVSTRGLLQSFRGASGQVAATWSDLIASIKASGLEPWLAEALEAAAAVIAGALNVLGLRRVIVTGSLAGMPAGVMAHLAQAIRKGAMWARFGEVAVAAAPQHRTAGLVAAGLDRLVLPMTEQGNRSPGRRHRAMLSKRVRRPARAPYRAQPVAA